MPNKNFRVRHGFEVGEDATVTGTVTASSISLTTYPTTTNITEGSRLYYTDARARASNSGGTGVTYNTSTGEIAIGQAVGTTDSPTFNNINITGNITDTGALQISTGSNGNLTLAPNGTGKVILSDNSTVLGNMLATTNANYTFSPLGLTSLGGNNGLDVASSMPAGSLGNGAQQQITHYFGDTFAGPLSTAVLSLKAALGNSVTGGTVPFTGLSQTAASALLTNAAMGTINYNGYATTGFTDYIGTRRQGGGFNGTQALQIQGFAAENFADGTLTISGATITNVTRFSTTLSSVSVSGPKGQISFTGTATAVGTAINVTGTNSGTSTGITAGTYYVVAATSTTNITLSATPGGAPINTTAGTTTGLTFLRRGITVTYSAQSYIPFGANALIDVANITGVTNGTYMALGTSTTTSVTLGVDTTAVSLPGTQSLSLPTVTNAGSAYRVRAMPVAVPMNSGNRVEIIDHRPSAAIYRADTITFSAGTYGNTGASYMVINNDKILNNRPHRSAVTAVSQARGTTYTPAAGVNNFIELTLTSGTDPTYIDVDNLSVAGEGGHVAILVYNNSGSAIGNGDLRIRNNGAQISDNTGTTVANGSRGMFTVYFVNNYASCEFMSAA